MPRTAAPTPRRARIILTALLVTVLTVLGGTLTVITPGATAEEGGLTVTAVDFSCECGGFDAPYGRNGIAVTWTDTTPGSDPTYRVRADPGPVDATDVFGWVPDGTYEGTALFRTVDLTPGQTYEFVVEQIVGDTVLETSAPFSFLVPPYIGHPEEISIVGARSPDGELMPGGSYRIEWPGDWEEGARFYTSIYTEGENG